MKVTYIDHMGSDDRVAESVRTKTQKRILEAVQRGYTVSDDGRLFSTNKELKYGLHGTQRYPTFSTNWNGIVFSIPIHLLASYVFYGTKAFERGIVVRHLNGNTLDFSKANIVLGTHSENNLDKPKHIRIKAARLARKAQGVRPRNAKLTDEQVRRVKDFYKSLSGKKAPNGTVSKLADELGVCRHVICNIKIGKSYAS